MISYDRGGPCEIQRAFLGEAFDIECDRRGCARPNSELEESNARCLINESLDNAIGDLFRMEMMLEKSLRAY
jgi:hypothetical protein